MPGTGILTFSGTLTGYPTGSRVINISFPIVSSVDDSMSFPLQVGDNLVAIPEGANGVVIDPPAGNSVIITLSGQPGSVGIGLHPTFPLIWFIPAAQSTFTLNVPSLPPGNHQITFF